MTATRPAGRDTWEVRPDRIVAFDLVDLAEIADIHINVTPAYRPPLMPQPIDVTARGAPQIQVSRFPSRVPDLRYPRDIYRLEPAGRQLEHGAELLAVPTGRMATSGGRPKITLAVPNRGMDSVILQANKSNLVLNGGGVTVLRAVTPNDIPDDGRFIADGIVTNFAAFNVGERGVLCLTNVAPPGLSQTPFGPGTVQLAIRLDDTARAFVGSIHREAGVDVRFRGGDERQVGVSMVQSAQIQDRDHEGGVTGRELPDVHNRELLSVIRAFAGMDVPE